jgi:hypothetical protein
MTVTANKIKEVMMYFGTNLDSGVAKVGGARGKPQGNGALAPHNFFLLYGLLAPPLVALGASALPSSLRYATG